MFKCPMYSTWDTPGQIKDYLNTSGKPMSLAFNVWLFKSLATLISGHTHYFTV